MRTQQEILDFIPEFQKEDFFSFGVVDLIMRLEFKDAKPYLLKGTKKSDYKPSSLKRQDILDEMLKYMPFAWEKACNCRGISAGRSMLHYAAWLWLLGDEDYNFFGGVEELGNYEYYGKDKLVDICNRFGWDPAQWDDGIRINSEEELEDFNN
jgi:hypothetical protein